jgi:hypothetical protein
MWFECYGINGLGCVKKHFFTEFTVMYSNFIDQSVQVLPASLRHSITFIIHRNEF